jgi:hypothetical protein
LFHPGLSRRNGCLLKFLAEIRRVEHWRIILAELLFEHIAKFAWQGESLNLAGLSDFLGNLDDAFY